MESNHIARDILVKGISGGVLEFFKHLWWFVLIIVILAILRLWLDKKIAKKNK